MAYIKIVGPIPGPKSKAVQERRAKFVAPGVGLAHPICIDHASGFTVTDVDGNTFIDFTVGIGVVNMGHTHPGVVRAVAEQAKKLTHGCFQVVNYESYIDVAEALCRLMPGNFDKRALLVSTGAEAVENAIKIARGHTKRQAILCFEHGFHGRTSMGLALTGKADPYKAGFGPFPSEIYRLPYPYAYRGQGQNIGSPGTLEFALKPHVKPSDLAAIILEPVLGEGGFIAAPREFLTELRTFCDKHGVVLIADEIQSGFGRTGKVFASETIGFQPDLMTSAKSIAGGLPLAAVIGRASIIDSVGPGGLGGTYAGNPIACAAALEAIAAIEDAVKKDLPNQVGLRIRGRMEALQKDLPIIGDVRGLGAMQAIELVRDRKTKEPAVEETKKIIAFARDRGVLLLSAGSYANVLRFLPPVNMPMDALDEALAVIEQALRSLST